MRPVLLSVGSFTISSFGFFASIAFLVGTFLVWLQGRDARLSEEKIFDTVFTTVLYGLIGARLFHVLFNFDLFSVSLLRIFLIWKFPGFSLTGGILFSIIALWFVSRSKKFVIWQIFDIYALAFLPAFSIGAIGALLDGAQVGTPTNLFWGVAMAGYEQFRHPLGMYESLFALVSFVIFSRIRDQLEKKKMPFGLTALLVFAAMNLFLFFLAFIKEDQIYFMELNINQLVSFVSVIIAVIYIPKRSGRNLKKDFQILLSKLDSSFKSGKKSKIKEQL